MSGLIFDGKPLDPEPGSTLLRTVFANDLYIPTLCFHPDLPPAEECGLCAVEVEGRGLVAACTTVAEPGMVVHSDTEAVRARRRERLAAILAHHPHACLTCAQAEGCSLTQCSSNVPEPERCCPKFGACELQQVAAWIGIPPETPRYVPADLPRFADDPLFVRNLNLCIACTRCVRACRDLRGVDILEMTEIKGHRVAVPKDGASLVAAGCRFCGSCVEVCPTGAILEKTIRTARGWQRILPCAGACPAGVNIPGYLRLAAQGRFGQALDLILSRVPLPGILGHICPAPCEEVCRRADLGGPAAIGALKRACNEYGDGKRALPAAGPPTGKRVAVVGAGPAGLTATVELRRLGHEVTLLDEQRRPGGVLRRYVPSFRLPREVINRDVDRILALGVEFRGQVRVGRDITVDRLLEEYDAVLLAVGAQRARRIELANSDLPGVHWGMEFLRAAGSGRRPDLSGCTLVVGGGSVAVDCAMTALRLGAEEAVLCCLESRGELPAHPADLESALEEGVTIMLSWGPQRVLEEDGRAAGLELVRCTSVFDDAGAFAPRFDDSVRKSVRGDTVVLAVGQEVDRQVLTGLSGFENGAGPIPGLHTDYASGPEGLYACGDALLTTTTVIEAIRSGRGAALAVDRHLGGPGTEAPPSTLGRGEPRLGQIDGFAARTRIAIPRRPAGPRQRTWEVVTPGISREVAMAEAARCLQCDLRFGLHAPPAPPQRLLKLTEADIGPVPEAAGVYRLYDASRALFAITGTADLHGALQEKLDSEKAAFFDFELNEMYTARESELLQHYLAEHGEMPAGEEDLDDLF
ncbi:MAG: FAD-dependent oxidoreductase [Planctomycetota bacterium]|jgi:NADPH-dependent glutamate synthase beta subunit-like oxidoreductase/Pyruvate/2-oxoacid:ferredoxin oxidoreductase delta subunit